MITYKSGDLFTDDAHCWINAVNCEAIMGKGIALQFKRLYPAYFKDYTRHCDDGTLKNKGDVSICGAGTRPRWIMSVATKTHWRDTSTLAGIERALPRVVALIGRYEIASLAMPALGCGLGGLSWNDVQMLIEQELSDVDCDIRVYLPQ